MEVDETNHIISNTTITRQRRYITAKKLYCVVSEHLGSQQLVPIPKCSESISLVYRSIA